MAISSSMFKFKSFDTTTTFNANTTNTTKYFRFESCSEVVNLSLDEICEFI